MASGGGHWWEGALKHAEDRKKKITVSYGHYQGVPRHTEYLGNLLIPDNCHGEDVEDTLLHRNEPSEQHALETANGKWSLKDREVCTGSVWNTGHAIGQ